MSWNDISTSWLRPCGTSSNEELNLRSGGRAGGEGVGEGVGGKLASCSELPAGAGEIAKESALGAPSRHLAQLQGGTCKRSTTSTISAIVTLPKA